MYKAMAAPIPDAPRTIRNKGITITKRKEGGWIPVYQQTTGITTVVKSLLPETRLVDRFFSRSSTTCVSSP